METSRKITWEALEHEHIEKKTDWYWAVGIVAVAGAILAIYFSNVLFAIVILIGAFASMLHGHSKPKVLVYEIGRKGIKVGEVLFPYSSLESFWVIDEEDNSQDKIFLKSQKFLMPLIIMPFDSRELEADSIRDYLLDYLDEEELEEPLSQIIMERFGF